MTKRYGKDGALYLDLKPVCDICGKNRGLFDHSRCSKVRQAKYKAMEARP